MSRPLILLVVLVAVGAGAGAFLHLRQKPAPSSDRPRAVSQRDTPSEPLGTIAPPRIPGLDPSIDMEATAGSNPEDAQVKNLQAQVMYLQDQVDLLTKENSDLVDKLASLTGKPKGETGTTPPCDPAMGKGSNGEAPDFVGIGIQLVKTRELQDIPLVTLTVDRAEVQQKIATWLSKQYPADYGKRQGQALTAIGAIPEPVDTVAMKASFLAYQIGGWYDPDAQSLLIADHASDRENALALAYGYLFKHYGKALFPAANKDKAMTMDHRLAVESVLAGDAALTRFLHALRYPDKGGGGGVGEDPDDPSRSVPIPNFLRELELLPFGMGLDFMQAMHSIGGWDQVNAVYERLPTATAEILDPEVYLGEQPFQPLPITLANKKVAGAAPLWEDTMGPLGLVLLLKQHVAEPVAAETAPGWSNDTWLTYSAGKGAKRDHAVWQTLWRDTNGADAFFSAMRTGLLSRYKGVTPNAEAGKGVFELKGPERHVRMERTHNGQGVLFIDAADAAFLKAAVETFVSKDAAAAGKK